MSETTPVTVLTVLGVYAIFFAMLTAAGIIPAPETGIGTGLGAPNVDESPEEGKFRQGILRFLGVILDFIRALIAGITFIINMLTFNIPGVPGWIRAIIATAINSSLLWSIIRIVRGI
jgi:hypothetical protein